MAQPHQFPFSSHITTSGTFPVSDTSGYIAGFIISIGNAGQNWLVSIQDRSNPPVRLLPPTDFNKNPPPELLWVIDLTRIRPYMNGGVDLITSSGTGVVPGMINVWILGTYVPTSY